MMFFRDLSYKGFISLLPGIFLTGCVTYEPEFTEPDLYLELHQNIQVETNRARVYLQNGRVVHTNNLETYGPSCDFEVREVSKAGSEQVIKSDDFVVTRVYYAPPDYYTSYRYQPYEQYAREGYEFPNTTYLIEFSLDSEKQPDVLRLNCKIWSISPWQKYLSPGQIDQTLGKIASLVPR